MIGQAEYVDKRHCAYCDGVIAGRTDKKFCNTACRSAFHNESLAGFLKKVRPIITLLQQNHAILKEAFQKGDSTSKQALLEKGYHPGYCTEHFQAHGRDHYFCLDMGYMDAGDHLVLVKREQMDLEVQPLPELTLQLISHNENEPVNHIKKKL